MRFYLDQMIGTSVADVLRQEGHDVVWAEEAGQARADDQDIFNASKSENRILITLDKDFGDWIFLPLFQHPGVIRISVHPTKSQTILEVLLPFLRENVNTNFHNRLVILSKHRTRWIKSVKE